MNRALLQLSILSVLMFIPSVYSNGCTPCPQFCSNCYWNGQQVVITNATKGYSIDSINQICYPTCAQNQYYNYQNQSCVSCGYGCATCTFSYSTGLVTVLSAQSGFTLDAIVNTCYACASNQYYDPFRHRCFNCPPGCATCQFQQFSTYAYNVTVLKAMSGYVIDDVSNTCTLTCPAGQYYVKKQNICKVCPTNCATCTEDIDGNSYILSATSGYSVDNYNRICYRTCTSSQYYDSTFQGCINCPNGCATCQELNGVFTITSASKNYTIDSINNVCYVPCGTGSYYDYFSMRCLSCPTYCSSCYYNTTVYGLVITGANTGYQIDNYRSECYASCATNQYYRAGY